LTTEKLIEEEYVRTTILPKKASPAKAGWFVRWYSHPFRLDQWGAEKAHWIDQAGNYDGKEQRLSAMEERNDSF
jgi:hypothetical protein